MAPKYQLCTGCWLVTALLGFTRLCVTYAHHSRVPAQGATSPLFFVVKGKSQRTDGDIYCLLMLLLWTGVWHVCSSIISQSEAGKWSPRTGMRRKSCSSGQEWLILSPGMEWWVIEKRSVISYRAYLQVMNFFFLIQIFLFLPCTDVTVE